MSVTASPRNVLPNPIPSSTSQSTNMAGGHSDSSLRSMSIAKERFIIEQTSSPDLPNDESPHIWNSSWLQTRPILGLISLTVAVGCMFASLAVLYVSDGKPVDTAFWKVQPTVYLAIAVSLGAFAIRFAMSQAIPVAWWFRALRGRSIRELQYQWEAGQGPLHAMLRFSHAPFVSAASLVMILMLVDGAFLQRANTIISATTTESKMLSFQLSPELPYGFAGYMEDDSLIASNIANNAWTDWILNTTSPLAVQGCGPTSTCKARIHAPGLAQVNCSKQVWPISNASFHDPHARWGNFHDIVSAATYLNDPSYGNATIAVNPGMGVGVAFLTATAPHVSPEMLEMSTGFMQCGGDGGSYTDRLCYFVPAILEYDVQLSGGNLILPNDLSSAKVVALANNTYQYNTNAPHTVQQQTLSLFIEAYEAYTKVNATVVLEPSTPGQTWALNPGTLNAFAMRFAKFGNVEEFLDPMSTMVSDLNNMMIRGAVKFSQSKYSSQDQLLDPGVKQNQSVTGEETTTRNVFRTDFWWFGAVAIIYLLVILAILPLFYGFWLLPRDCTLSPFATGLAFRSPLFTGIHSSAGTKGIIDRFGDVRIKYGIIGDDEHVTRLAFARVEDVRATEKGMEVLV